MKKEFTAEEYISKNERWQKELEKLRSILLSCDLDEVIKWGTPCYMFEGKNVVILHAFKEYCALLFFKGALMQDTDDMLVQQTNNTQATRQLRFTTSKQISSHSAKIKSYIYQAIEIEKAGLKVKFKKTEEFDMPDEFKTELKKDKTLKKAFEALTPGRQRGYLLYFSSAKQSATRVSRISKSRAAILDGRGLNE